VSTYFDDSDDDDDLRDLLTEYSSTFLSTHYINYIYNFIRLKGSIQTT